MHFLSHDFPIGSLVMNGPYYQTKICYLGSNCTLFLGGVGLRENDYLYLSTHSDFCSIPTNITDNMTYSQSYNKLT